MVKSNLINNKLTNPSNILDCITWDNSSFGDAFTIEPKTLEYICINEGSYSFIEISFVDQNYERVKILDPDIVVQLWIKVNAMNMS